MNHRHAPTKLGVLLALGLAAVLPLRAGADNIAFQGKFKGGLFQGDLKAATQRNSMIGLGIEMTYAFSADSKLVTELGYQYFSSQAIPRNFGAGLTVTGGTLTNATSSDVRKNDLATIGLKIGYRQGFAKDWSYQGGVTLDNVKSRQEVYGTLRAGTSTEGLAMTPEKSSLAVGFYGGLHQKISDSCTAEYNVHYFAPSLVNYLPRTYTGAAAASTESVRKGGIMLQVALGLTF